MESGSSSSSSSGSRVDAQQVNLVPPPAFGNNVDPAFLSQTQPAANMDDRLLTLINSVNMPQSTLHLILNMISNLPSNLRAWFMGQQSRIQKNIIVQLSNISADQFIMDFCSQDLFEKLETKSPTELEDDFTEYLRLKKSMELEALKTSQRVFILQSNQWTVADLTTNRIITTIGDNDVLNDLAEPNRDDRNKAMDEYLEELDNKRTLRESDLANWEALRQVVPLAGDYYTVNSSSQSKALNLVDVFELSALRTGTTETLQVINFWQHPQPQTEPPSQFGTSSSSGHPTRPLSQIARTTVITSMLVNSEESFYLPQLDLSVEAKGEYCRLLVEEKKAVDNREMLGGRLRKFKFTFVRRYNANVAEDLFRLMFNLFNLRDHRFDVVETPGRQAVMQKFQQRRAKCWLSGPKGLRGRKRAASESIDGSFSDGNESHVEDSETCAQDSRALGYEIQIAPQGFIR
ncbi:hypothetical protein HDU76_001358, partial [Blyttiomyces sp. JEL0837]